MLEEKIREIIKPVLEEAIQDAYDKGFEDGVRHSTNMYRYGWENGHKDTMAALGEIDIEEVENDEC